MKKWMLLLLTVVMCFGSFPVAAKDFGDIFAPFLTRRAPKITKILSETVTDGVKVTGLQFSSYNGKNTIYAKIFEPEADGKYPGVVMYHGGGGSSATNDALGQELAKNGYTCISSDIPGIGDPAKMTNSAGDFMQRSNTQEAQVGMYTDPRNSMVFDGIVASIDAFYLLASRDKTDETRMGITGQSWGGYMTTKIAGLLGDDVKCAYSTFGCAYFDEGTHWSKNVFPKFGEENEKLWMEYMDASVNLKGMTCPYFIEAPTNDQYFWPPAVKKTLENIDAYTNKAFTANTDHAPYATATFQKVAFFDYYLKNKGGKIVEVSNLEKGEETEAGLPITFTVSDDQEIASCRVFFADADLDWSEKKWRKADAEVKDGKGYAVIPSYDVFENTIFYVFALTQDKCYASSDMMTAEGLTVRELSDEEKAKLAKEDFIVSTIDDAFNGNGTSWEASGLSGYENKSQYSFSPDATASFRPFLEHASYEISVFVVAYKTNQPYLNVTMHTENGDVTEAVSTDLPGSDWVTVGTYDFAQGDQGGVTLSVYDEKIIDEHPIRIDSVRFRKVADITDTEEDTDPKEIETGDPEDPDAIKVVLKGKKLQFAEDQKPTIVDDRTLVPFRAIFEALGLTVDWDAETRTAIGRLDSFEIRLTIDSLQANVNGQIKELDVPAQIISDRTYVPLRFLSEAAGLQVDWDGETKTVRID